MNKQELIHQLASEDPTPGRWQTVIANDNDDTSARIMVIKPSAAGKANDLLEADDLIQVAWFRRPADLHRVMLCIAKFDGMPRDDIEAMPVSVMELVAARISLSQIVRDIAQAAVGTNDDWTECRKKMRYAHEAMMETERQRARPN